MGSDLLEGDQRRESEPSAFVWARQNVGVLLLALVVAVLPVAVLWHNPPPSWRAAQGGGVVGTFIASGECGKDWCSGRFVADDGQIVREGVRLVTDYGQMNAGDKARATDVGDSEVYKIADRVPMLTDLAFIFGITFIAAIFAGVKVKVWVRR